MATTHTLLFLPSSDLSGTRRSLVRGWRTGAPLVAPLSAFAPDVCSLRCYYEGTNAPIGNVTGGWVLGRGVPSHLHPRSSKLCTHRHSVLLGLPETYTASRAHEGPLQGPGARQPQDHPSAFRQTHSTRAHKTSTSSTTSALACSSQQNTVVCVSSAIEIYLPDFWKSEIKSARPSAGGFS